jgi:hypothetical protein
MLHLIKWDGDPEERWSHDKFQFQRWTNIDLWWARQQNGSQSNRSFRRDVFLSLAQQAANRGQSTEKELEIRLYQENLSHLDELKALIPSLHEYRPPAKVLSVRLEEVTERAIELLNELQLEYRIHPLLEDNDVFAQG